jgi:hypothetical protein
MGVMERRSLFCGSSDTGSADCLTRRSAVNEHGKWFAGRVPSGPRAGVLLCAGFIMRSPVFFLLAVAFQAFVLLGRAQSAGAEGEILPPFGLAWGLAFERVEESLRTAGGRIVERAAAGSGEERWAVEGLVQDGLQRVLFTFGDGRLTGVELQYGKDEWDAETYAEFVRRVRAGLDAAHGRGRLLVRQRDPHPGVLKTMLGIYFSAQDQRNLFRLVSLHYSARQRRAHPQAVSRS